MKVLFLSCWYPHRYDRMSGAFVRKHAIAVSQQGADVCVLCVHREDKQPQMEIVEQETEHVKEIYVYYNPKESDLLALKKGWQQVYAHWGMPQVVQLNVITPTHGLLALWLKKRHHIPFVIVEHWSGYLPENGMVADRGWLYIQLIRYIARNASAILPVSYRLQHAMQALGLKNTHWEKINNVVDDFFYAPYEKESHPNTRLLHVSGFCERAKNIRGMLRALRAVADVRQDFQMLFVGNDEDYQETRKYAEQLCFPDGILSFTGKIATSQEVCRYMQQSDVFLMFSKYENAPVVLSECKAVGLPIICSNAGGMPEMMTKETGLIVPSEDEEALKNAIIYMLDHHQDFNPNAIRTQGKQYSFNAVGKQLRHIYQQAMTTK